MPWHALLAGRLASRVPALPPPLVVVFVVLSLCGAQACAQSCVASYYAGESITVNAYKYNAQLDCIPFQLVQQDDVVGFVWRSVNQDASNGYSWRLRLFSSSLLPLPAYVQLDEMLLADPGDFDVYAVRGRFPVAAMHPTRNVLAVLDSDVKLLYVWDVNVTAQASDAAPVEAPGCLAYSNYWAFTCPERVLGMRYINRQYPSQLLSARGPAAISFVSGSTASPSPSTAYVVYIGIGATITAATGCSFYQTYLLPLLGDTATKSLDFLVLPFEIAQQLQGCSQYASQMSLGIRLTTTAPTSPETLTGYNVYMSYGGAFQAFNAYNSSSPPHATTSLSTTHLASFTFQSRTTDLVIVGGTEAWVFYSSGINGVGPLMLSRLDLNGNLLAASVQLSTTPAFISGTHQVGEQEYIAKVAAATLASGGIVVVWASGTISSLVSTDQISTDYVFATVLCPQTAVVTMPQTLVSALNSRASNPAVTALSNGNFLVAWQANSTSDPDNDLTDVFARVFSTHSPPIVNIAPSDQHVFANTVATIVLAPNTFFDSAGYQLSYQSSLKAAALPSWLIFVPSTLTFQASPSPLNRGSYSVLVTCIDTFGGAATASFTLFVDNNTPKMTAVVTNQLLEIGDQLSMPIQHTWFSDADFDPLTLSVTSTNGTQLPGWLAFDPVSNVLHTTGPVNQHGKFSIAVHATDPYNAYASITFVISVDNRAPVSVNPPLNATLYVGTSYATAPLTYMFADPDGDQLFFSFEIQRCSMNINGSSPCVQVAQPMPSWMSVSEGVFSAIPVSGAQQSIYIIDVISNDTFGGVSGASFVLTVLNRAPVVPVQLPDPIFAYVGVPLVVPITVNNFADPDGDSLSLTAATTGGQMLPGWLTLTQTASSWLLGGVPATVATAPLAIQVIATDPFGLSVGQVLSVTITANTTLYQPPAVINPVTSITATSSLDFSFAVPSTTFLSGDGEIVAYSVPANSLPSWLHFNATLALFYGTPPATFQGTFSVPLSATNSIGLTTTYALYFTVLPIQPPTVATPVQQQTAFVGEPFSLVLSSNTFTDPQGSLLTLQATFDNAGLDWSSFSYGLPTWLVFDSTLGTFSGTPGSNDTGGAVVMLTAVNHWNLTASMTFTVLVQGRSTGLIVLQAVTSSVSAIAFVFSCYRNRRELLQLARWLVRRGPRPPFVDAFGRFITCGMCCRRRDKAEHPDVELPSDAEMTAVK